MNDEPLTAYDRCDKCGSQAYVRIVVSLGYDLLLCGHHWQVNKTTVEELNDAHVYSELDKLTADL